MSGKTKNAADSTDELCCSILDAIHLDIEGELKQSRLLSCQSENPELLKGGPDMCEPGDDHEDVTWMTMVVRRYSQK